MENCLRNLQLISTSESVIHFENSMQSELIHFLTLFPLNSYDLDYQDLEKLFLRLLNINNGQISFSTSLMIGRCLVNIYLSENKNRFWNLIAQSTDKPTPASLFAVGYVVWKIGKNF